jgi:hypothetical protein
MDLYQVSKYNKYCLFTGISMTYSVSKLRISRSNLKYAILNMVVFSYIA